MYKKMTRLSTWFREISFRCIVCVFLLSLAACATQPQNDSADAAFDDGQNDPLESFNRRIFGFNNFVDRWFLKPAAKGYQWITPSFVDRAVTNFFQNIDDVPNLLNAGLQGDFNQMAHSTGRVLVNSTIGLAGFIDVASDFDLEKRNEDFGQTLAVWGVGSGAYVELPLLGGRNLRDAFSIVPDWFLNPVSYIDEADVRFGLSALEVVDTRADLIALESFVAGDRYSFLRDVYRQRRQAAVNNGTANSSESGAFDDDFGDDDFGDEDL